MTLVFARKLSGTASTESSELGPFQPRFGDEPGRTHDIGVWRALGFEALRHRATGALATGCTKYWDRRQEHGVVCVVLFRTLCTRVEALEKGAGIGQCQLMYALAKESHHD